MRDRKVLFISTKFQKPRQSSIVAASHIYLGGQNCPEARITPPYPTRQAESRLHSSAGPNWEQFQSAQVPNNLHQGLYLYVLDNLRVDYTLARGPIGNSFSRPRFPVNLHQGLYLYVLDKPRVTNL